MYSVFTLDRVFNMLGKVLKLGSEDSFMVETNWTSDNQKKPTKTTQMYLNKNTNIQMYRLI